MAYINQITVGSSTYDVMGLCLGSNSEVLYNVGDENTPIYFKNGIPVEGISPLYSIPAATSITIGGIKIGYSQSGKNYSVQVNDDNQAYVNVPWSDTWREIQVNGNAFIYNDNDIPLNLVQSGSGFATIEANGADVVFDTKFRIAQSIDDFDESDCVYLIPSELGNPQQSYIISSTQPSDHSKIWVDSTNGNAAKVWSGSSWVTLGAVWD